MFTFFQFSCFTILTLVAVSVSAQQGNFKNYSVNDGLAQSQVYSIAEADDGFLWIGTRGGGLCKFDGLEFNTFTKKEGLPSNYVNALFQDKNKHLWIGTSDGLCVFRDNNFESVKLQGSGSPAYVVSALSNDHLGQLWLGTNQGLFLRQDSIFVKQALYPENIKSKFSQEVTCIIQGQDSSMWIGTNRGLVNIKNGTIQRYSTREGLRNNYVHSLSFDNVGNLWIGTYGKGISIFASDGIKQESKLNELNESIIHQLTTDENHNMWIATLEEGLVKWNVSDSTLTYFTESDGLANNHVRCMHEDSWGNLWIGTSGGGISKFSGQHFNEYNTASIGLKSNYIYAVNAVNDSDLWISNSGFGVDRYINNKIQHYGIDSGFVNDKVKTIHNTNDSIVWFGTEGKGLYVFKDDSMQHSGVNVGSQWVKDVTEDRDGKLWVATSGGGITKISTSKNGDKSLLRLTRKKGLKSDRVSVLHVDKWNRTWYAYQNGGVGYVHSDSTIHNFPLSHGTSESVVRSITEDSVGNLWMGTAGNGIYQLKIYTSDTSSFGFKSFSSNDKLSSDNIYLMAVDKQNNLWIGSEKGVDKVVVGSEGELLEVSNYSKDEGFKGVETSRNAITVDNQGGVWIGTINGLFRYNETFTSFNKKAPVLKINDVSLFYNSVKKAEYGAYLNSVKEDLNSVMLLNHDQNHLTFDFKGVLLTKPAQVKYKWKLKGYETAWSPVTKKSSITYSNIKPGHYVFEVVSSNEDGVWNSKAQIVAFEILTPYWATLWFRVFGAIVVLLLVGFIVWLRIKFIQKKANDMQELLKMENEVLVLEQKALRLQMNPHFIFNCLNSIQSMIVKKDHKTARYFLAKFSKLMRKTLDNSREQLILLDDEIETLENYLSIEKFCNEDHFEYEITVSNDMASDFIQLPPMLIQPFVENAIVHGVAHKKTGGKISVNFADKNGKLICCIVDNGVGRAVAGTINNRENHKSTALIVTQERLDLLANETNSSKLLIEDLINEKGEVSGTKVTIEVAITD